MRAKVRLARGDWPSAEPAALDGQVDINTRISILPSLSLPIRTCHLRQKCSTLRTELDTDVYTGTVGDSLRPALVHLSFGGIPPLAPGSPGSWPPPDATPAERCQGSGTGSEFATATRLFNFGGNLPAPPRM